MCFDFFYSGTNNVRVPVDTSIYVPIYSVMFRVGLGYLVGESVICVCMLVLLSLEKNMFHSVFSMYVPNDSSSANRVSMWPLCRSGFVIDSGGRVFIVSSFIYIYLYIYISVDCCCKSEAVPNAHPPQHQYH